MLNKCLDCEGYIRRTYSRCYMCNIVHLARYAKYRKEHAFKLKCRDMKEDIEINQEIKYEFDNIFLFQHLKYLKIKKDMDKLRFINYLNRVYL